MPPSRRRPHAELRISDIRELRDVSRDKFLQFLKTVRENPSLLATLCHRGARTWMHDLHRRLDSVLVISTYELKEDAGTYTLESCDPGELVQLLCIDAPKLGQLYMAAHRKMPSSRERPWHIVLGFDEFLPGNPTAGQHSKKTMCLYFNFVELGHATLVESATWHCPMVLPTEMEVPILK
jgi:hypothetical protein